MGIECLFFDNAHTLFHDMRVRKIFELIYPMVSQHQSCNNFR